ncbi:Alw26I/Eco31I/Esp3I family type II restriction endonuclease [Arcicella sp. LKC2W]|uniref:Alw26I/Eco31I/Esp3I family type II restriction endonuclease n=1 Tax=Arcicella sp. LKC2W TaxID=2984198 RepID=UPI002B21146C|nr:Alw26I/Eco31I/Esp3I family type II restriction endonuclease [Arcicella sp. LKC2W]MEA5461678.1 Alw26I/Eco31I/Esp3I family type II restriction endonuclease [Arcicella sp. LKC2W]
MKEKINTKLLLKESNAEDSQLTSTTDIPNVYGSKGEKWSTPFVNYMEEIVNHPTYANMPDAIKDDGKIQWEAPSNRSSGKYQFTHQKRRDWWLKKAKEVGIDSNSDKWISRTAKLIHPTGEKPCKRCGRILRIGYAYPNDILINKIKKSLGNDFIFSSLDQINDIILNAFNQFGDKVIGIFSKLLSTPTIKVPQFSSDIETFINWVKSDYIPLESSLLSPGVMSNPPDRLDGFHSFNKCCRGKADKGRSSENLKSYTTDRRVFEYWSDGDWIAADDLMGLIRTRFKNEINADGGEGLPTADHIGPLSLGFCHRPEFRLLSKKANSAKNNRMSLQDVQDLIKAEKQGLDVVSWYAKPLWDLRKNDITNDEEALRLSKMLRDNQRNALFLFSVLLEKKMYFFLTYFLELGYADFKLEFVNLRIENFLTVYDSIIKEKKYTKYTIEQKARRIRIGFEALFAYRDKINRHLLLVNEDSVRSTVNNVVNLIRDENYDCKYLDEQFEHILLYSNDTIEHELRLLVTTITSNKIEVFETAKKILTTEMISIATYISAMWENDRYLRTEFILD